MVFLIGWNASVIGVLIGKDIVQASLSNGSMLESVASGLFNALGLVPHGFFESLGYFLGAISGGIIGAAISKKKHLKGEFGAITKDSAVMLVYAMGCLALGAIIEAYVIVYSL
ncbi:MAG: stage II sporulation protein M [Candidatus Diapherotrites archaeon]|nr:stage II sporulation protein M [Candidatus Diapherotrites archaeon]